MASWKDEYDRWRGVVIREIKQDLFHIEIRHPEDDEEKESPLKWAKESEVFKEPQNVKYVDKKPFNEYYNPPYPKYYFDSTSNKHYIIISQNHRDQTSAIHFYDIEKDEYVKKVPYPDNFQPSAHGITVDSSNHIIYFYNHVDDYTTDTEHNYFAAYNILTKEWNIHEYDGIMPGANFPRAFFTNSAMYFYASSNGHNHIMKYSPENKKCVDILKNFPEESLDDSSMGCDEKNYKIMLYGGVIYGDGDAWIDEENDDEEFDDIWTYDIDQDDVTGKWELYPLKMPYKTQHRAEFIFAFDSIMFVIYCDHEDMNEIWCLELMSKQWFKSHVLYPYELHDLDVIKTNDNHIHCMNDVKVNIRINLYDMIPLELMQFYSRYYVPLINGYVRLEYETKFGHGMHVSQDLKQLISKYFNAFL